MDDETASEILQDWRRNDLPGLIVHPDGRKNFQPSVYSLAERQQLLSDAKRGVPWREIARKQGRSIDTILRHARAMGLR